MCHRSPQQNASKLRCVRLARTESLATGESHHGRGQEGTVRGVKKQRNVKLYKCFMALFIPHARCNTLSRACIRNLIPEKSLQPFTECFKWLKISAFSVKGWAFKVFTRFPKHSQSAASVRGSDFNIVLSFGLIFSFPEAPSRGKTVCYGTCVPFPVGELSGLKRRASRMCLVLK